MKKEAFFLKTSQTIDYAINLRKHSQKAVTRHSKIAQP